MPGVTYLGLDPGAAGGVAALCPEQQPAVLFRSLGKLSEVQLWEWLQRWGRPTVRSVFGETPRAYAVLERIVPGTFVGTGKASSAKLYGSFRMLRAMLVASGIPFREVKSGDVWRALGIPPRCKGESRTTWKGRLAAEARRRFPELKVTLATADALLLAYYCMKVKGG